MAYHDPRLVLTLFTQSQQLLRQRKHSSYLAPIPTPKPLTEDHLGEVRRLAQNFAKLSHAGIGLCRLSGSETFNCEQQISQCALQGKLPTLPITALGQLQELIQTSAELRD